ncbi:MAG: FkbM family methyltransferase [Verrucomicrobiia bacterium]
MGTARQRWVDGEMGLRPRLIRRLNALCRRQAKVLLRRVGLSFDLGNFAHKYAFGCHLAELFARLGVDCVLDVGGYTGLYRDFLRTEVGYRGLIVTFEPVPDHIEVLKRRAQRDSAWVIYGVALGPQRGEGILHLMNQGDFTSFLEPDHSMVPEFASMNTIRADIKVPVHCLDDVYEELRSKHAISRPYLKLDTQGYDCEVINGGGKVMEKVVGLQTEVSIRRIYRGMPSFVEVYERLTALGFSVTGMYPVSRDGQGRVVEFDCVMIRDHAG